MSFEATPQRFRPHPRPSPEPARRPSASILPRGSWSLRWAALALVISDVAMVVGLAGRESVLAQPGGPRYVIALLVALAAYLVAAMVVTSGWGSWVTTARRVGVTVGVITGAMWLLSLAVETFAGLKGWPNIAVTGPLLLGGFALWGVAAVRTARRTNSVAAGAFSAVCAAMTCVAITIALGLALAYLALPRLEHNIDGSPEYLASGWHNLPAFAIANTLDAAFTHLLLAPVIAALLGTLGARAARRRRAELDPI